MADIPSNLSFSYQLLATPSCSNTSKLSLFLADTGYVEEGIMAMEYSGLPNAARGSVLMMHFLTGLFTV